MTEKTNQKLQIRFLFPKACVLHILSVLQTFRKVRNHVDQTRANVNGPFRWVGIQQTEVNDDGREESAEAWEVRKNIPSWRGATGRSKSVRKQLSENKVEDFLQKSDLSARGGLIGCQLIGGICPKTRENARELFDHFDT